MIDFHMNERAWALAEDCIARADELRLGVQTLASGTRVIDAGIDAPGGLAAGLALAELCMGGLGHVGLTSLTIGGESWEIPCRGFEEDHLRERSAAEIHVKAAGWSQHQAKYGRQHLLRYPLRHEEEVSGS